MGLQLRAFRLALILLCAAPTFANDNCNILVSLMDQRPVLYDEQGNEVLVPARDWKEFLEKTITLSDGTTFHYRDFDRLGPDFWARYPNDWLPVAKQLHTDLSKELEKRGIDHDKVYTDAGSPMNRYALGIKPSEKTVLGRINQALSGEGLHGLWFSPARQMGVRAEPGMLGQSGDMGAHLPLSWVAMNDCHACMFVKQGVRAATVMDDLTLLRAYLYGDTGKMTTPGLEITYGPFQTDWPARQTRRGPRAFRVRKTDLAGKKNPEYQVGKREHALADEISAAIKAVKRDPQSENAHEQLARKTAEYLVSTGIPVSVTPAPQGTSFDIHIVPLDDAQWKKFNDQWTTTGVDGSEVKGSENPPDLVRVAAAAKKQGFETVFNTFTSFNGNYGFDVQNSRLILYPLGIASQVPMERYLLGPNASDYFPIGKSRVVTVLTTSEDLKEDIGFQPVWRHASDLAMAGQIRDDINRLKSIRTFVPADEYQRLLEHEMATLRAFHASAERSQSSLGKLLAGKLRPSNVTIVERAGDTAVVALPSATDASPNYAVLEIPRSLNENEVQKEAARLIANERESVATGKAKLKALRDFLKVNAEREKAKNALSLDQLAAFQKKDKMAIEEKLAGFGMDLEGNRKFQGSWTYSGEPPPPVKAALPPEEYFQKLFDEPGIWSEVAPKILKEYERQITSQLGKDPAKLTAFVDKTKHLFLQPDSKWVDGAPVRGVEHYVADAYMKILHDAVKQHPQVVLPMAKEFIQKSKSSAVAMFAYGVLEESGARDAEVRNLVLDGLKRNDVGVWAVSAAAKLFPEDTLILFPKAVLEGPSDMLRTGAYSALTREQNFDERLLLSAVRGIDLPTNGSPGPDGYLAASKTKNPKVHEAIRKGIAEATKNDKTASHLLRVVMDIGMRDPETIRLVRENVTRKPEEGYYAYDILYEANPRDPFVIEFYAAKLRARQYHAWARLELLDKITRVQPDHPDVKDGIAYIDEETSKSDYAGFDHALFKEVKKRAKVL